MRSVPDAFGEKEPASSQKEALEMFEAWCEINGGDLEGHISDYPEIEFMGTLQCNMGENFEMEMNAGRATLAPDHWMDENDSDIEVRIRETAGSVGHTTHRKGVHHSDVNFTDTAEELHVDWETFYAGEQPLENCP